MSNYPGGLDNFTDGVPNQPLNNPSLTNIVNDLNAAVRAIQQTLGINPQTPESSLAARLTAGVGLREILVFQSSGVFTKADYPWLRVIYARVQAAGGGSGGCGSTGSGESAESGGGGGGGYVEKLYFVDELNSSETATVGNAGTGGSGASNGGDGGDSSFRDITAEGGNGGIGMAGGSGELTVAGGAGGLASGDGLMIPGEDGFAGTRLSGTTRVRHNRGGSSHWGAGGYSHTTNTAGNRGEGYGCGAGGTRIAANQSSQNGSTGRNGRIILELYG